MIFALRKYIFYILSEICTVAHTRTKEKNIFSCISRVCVNIYINKRKDLSSFKLKDRTMVRQKIEQRLLVLFVYSHTLAHVHIYIHSVCQTNFEREQFSAIKPFYDFQCLEKIIAMQAFVINWLYTHVFLGW